MSDPATWLRTNAEVDCCYLTTTGRNSGRAHEIEIWFGVIDGALCLISGNGDGADWYRNLIAEPEVAIRLVDETHRGRARVIDDPDQRSRVGDVMGAKYVWDGDQSIGLTYRAWCYEVPAVTVEF